MPDEPPATPAMRDLAAGIVAAYVRRNQVAADQMPDLISSVYRALAGLGKPSAEAEPPRTPAVPIRQSVRRDYIVCLDCGWRGQMLRRHLGTAHDLTVQDYRARWKLPSDHPMTATGYSERRSTMAKQFGLGRGRAAAETGNAAEPTAQAPVRVRRRGPRSMAPTA